MVFNSNPLSLTVNDHSFETWMRDSGYLELLDLHSTTSSLPAETTNSLHRTGGFVTSLFSRVSTFLSLITVNPFSKLTTDDFSGPTASWTRSFFADVGSFSFPSGAEQARLRIHENVKRYAKNYAFLSIIFFACSLYQMPLALIGLASCLMAWDAFKIFSDKWGWDRYPVIWQILICAAQFGTATALLYLNIQRVLLWSICVSYGVMILHGAFRKLTPVRQPSQQRSHIINGR